MNYAEKQIHELKNLVTRYRRIPQQAHHDFIAFYENFYGLIHQLDFDEMVEMEMHGDKQTTKGKNKNES